MPLNPHIPISMDLDLAVQQKNHPILLEEQEGEEEVDYVLPLLPDEKEETLAEQVVDPSYSQSDDSTDSSEDEFGKSSKIEMLYFYFICIIFFLSSYKFDGGVPSREIGNSGKEYVLVYNDFSWSHISY